MKCKECMKYITFEREIPLSQKEQFEAHIAECEKCRAMLHSSREITGLLAAIDPVKEEGTSWDDLFRNIRSARIGYKAAREQYQSQYYN